MANPKAVIAKHTTEAEFQADIVAFAKAHGWLVHHCRPARTTKGWATPLQGDAGFVDLVLARNGVVHLWELKAQGKKPTEAQVAWIVASKARWWWPSQYEEMIRILE